jgi:hypothetical protein
MLFDVQAMLVTSSLVMQATGISSKQLDLASTLQQCHDDGKNWLYGRRRLKSELEFIANHFDLDFEVAA